MAQHHFGIIDQFNENQIYETFEPEKYNCTPVDMILIDLIIDKSLEELSKMKTYLGVPLRPFYGLNECGITIIPPESLESFRHIVIKHNSRIESNQLTKLIYKIEEAIQNNKHLIHYGI